MKSVRWSCCLQTGEQPWFSLLTYLNELQPDKIQHDCMLEAVSRGALLLHPTLYICLPGASFQERQCVEISGIITKLQLLKQHVGFRGRKSEMEQNMGQCSAIDFCMRMVWMADKCWFSWQLQAQKSEASLYRCGQSHTCTSSVCTSA